MMRVLNSDEMRRCDEYTINIKGVPSRVLMEIAAKCTADEIVASDFDLSGVLVVCGSGNNGGDGFATARFLCESGKCGSIRTVFVGNESSMTVGCALERRLSAECGIKEENRDDADFSRASLIVDAIFGIGLSRAVSGEYEIIINKINSSSAVKVSVDIPSGISADNGAVMGCAVKADLTVTYANVKRGQLLFPGRIYSGRLVLCDIGVDSDALKDEKVVFSSYDAPFPLPCRTPDSNKGTYGKVLVIGGAPCMAGAAYLSALAAYRMGAGLVRIFTSEENRVILQTLLPEAVLVTYPDGDTDIMTQKLKAALSDATSAVAGPGMSQSENASLQLKTVLEYAACPLVIDADALNILASHPEMRIPNGAPVIITPHMGEMSRLTGKSISELKNDPVGTTERFASEHGLICVLKDAATVISDGDQTYINTSGTNAMSKGGAGDVLAGIIAALIAEGKSEFDAACLGVFLHGMAGEVAAEKLGEYSLLARDIANSLPLAIKEAVIKKF